MNLKELEEQDMIRKFPVYPENVKSSIELARRDLETAKRTFETDHNWAFSIAYNSVLQAARALMFYKGYRPAGDRQHLSVAKFVETRKEKKILLIKLSELGKVYYEGLKE